MKRIITAALAALSSMAAIAATTVPPQLISPTGSTVGQAIVSSGPSSAPTWGAVTAGTLAPIAANTVLGNFTGSSAAPGAFVAPSCSTANSALKYTSGTGLSCGTTFALTSGNLSQFAATTSAQLLGVVSDETGSGALMFGTSPTIGTPTINTPTISGGTINNASVGATTPSTGSFTSLSASSTVSGTGFSTFLASPPAIGGATPAAGTFTTLKANSHAALTYTNTSGQSIPASTLTTVTNWTSTFDRNSNFNAASGVFTAPATGFYRVSGQLEYNGSSVLLNNQFQALVVANGSNVAVNNTTAGGAQNLIAVPFSVTVSLTSGQTVEIKAFQTSSGAQTLNTGAAVNWISVEQIP